MNKIVKATEKLPFNHSTFDKNGAHEYFKTVGQRTEYLNKKRVPGS